jgi:hypothetical protein
MSKRKSKQTKRLDELDLNRPEHQYRYDKKTGCMVARWEDRKYAQHIYFNDGYNYLD